MENNLKKSRPTMKMNFNSVILVLLMRGKRALTDSNLSPAKLINNSIYHKQQRCNRTRIFNSLMIIFQGNSKGVYFATFVKSTAILWRSVRYLASGARSLDISQRTVHNVISASSTAIRPKNAGQMQWAMKKLKVRKRNCINLCTNQRALLGS